MKRLFLFFGLIFVCTHIQTSQMSKEQPQAPASRTVIKRIADSMIRRSVLNEMTRKQPTLMATAIISAIDIVDGFSRSIGLALGGDPNVQDATGKPILMKALEADDITAAEELLGKGADANATYLEEPILICAIKRGRYNFATKFLQHKANPNVEFAGKSAFGYALEPYLGYPIAPYLGLPVEHFEGRLITFHTPSDLVQLFIDSGADMNKPYSSSESLLTHAAKSVIAGNADKNTVKILLGAGAPIDDNFLAEIQQSPELQAIYNEYRERKAKITMEIGVNQEDEKHVLSVLAESSDAR